MQPSEPKWRRRKEDRPGEIVAAALEVFAEKGFAAARLDDIAARAGLSKGALYLYFDTKQGLFGEAIRNVVAPNIAAVEDAVAAADLPFETIARMMIATFTDVMSGTRLGSVAKMVIAESGNFPDLARIWHEDVISRVMKLATGLIERAQERGEIIPGDARVHAFSLVGPIVIGVLWREVFAPVGIESVNLDTMAEQHAEAILNGILT